MAQAETASSQSAASFASRLIEVLNKIPAWAYALLVVAAVGWNCWSSALALGKGTVAYALDDSYIHMAIAKNLAFHGVWGVNPYEHVSASSSPAWILVLALAFKILGNHQWIPFALNVIAAVVLAYVLDKVLKAYAAILWVRAILVTAVLMILPVTLFVAMGMEHTLQAVLVAGFFAFARKIFFPGCKLSKRECLWLFGLSACMVLVRVEDFVLLPIPFIYLLVKKDFRAACALFAGPLAALGLFAAIAYSQGFGLEPTSMLVKRVHLGTGGSAAGKLLNTIWTNLNMFHEIELFIYVLLAILVVLALKPKGRGSSMLLIGTALFGFLAHTANGAFGWFYRYEGYLIVFSFLCLVAVCSEQWQKMRLAVPAGGAWRSYAIPGLAILGLASLVVRAQAALEAAPKLMMNIGWQQVQMGRFLSRYYNGRNVMLNDIGAVSYLGDFHLTDLVGLGSPDIARARVDGKLDAAFVLKLLVDRHIDLVMVYPGMLPRPPDDEKYPLIQVATWTLPRENSLVVPEVIIFATSMPETLRLRRNLKEFQPQLPAGVRVDYLLPAQPARGYRKTSNRREAPDL